MRPADIWVLRLTLAAVAYVLVLYADTCRLGHYVLVN
jgi:hypothetical protein